MRWLTVALFVAAFAHAEASDQSDGPIVSWPASPAQLVPGTVPGTYHYTGAAYVSFSREAEFPVDLVIEDYNQHEVFRLSLTDSKYVEYSCDLAPGSYRSSYQMKGKARRDYNDRVGDSFFITKDGRRGFDEGSYIQFTDISADSAPLKPFTVFTRKIILSDPEDKKEVAGGPVTFRWKPVSGVQRYLVSLWPIQDPNHPRSGYSAEIEQAETTGTSLTVKLDDLKAPLYLHAGRVYGWSVLDQDDLNQREGHIAQSDGAVFLTHGGWASVRHLTPSDYMRDDQVEAKAGFSVQQPYQPSDGSPAWLQITGIGRGSSALASGLQTHDEIHLVNGVAVQSLREFHSIFSNLQAGAPLTLRVERYDPDLKKRVSKDITITNG